MGTMLTCPDNKQVSKSHIPTYVHAHTHTHTQIIKGMEGRRSCTYRS